MNFLLTSYLAGTKTTVDIYLSRAAVRQITFIPTAGNVESYTGFIDEGINMLKELGYKVDVVDVAELDEPRLKRIISEAECVCVSGGNTFYLLQELRRKGLGEMLSRRIREGMPYIGESAGAIITAPDIAYAQIIDGRAAAPELTDYSGLNVFDHYVLPHLGEDPFKETTEETVRTYGDHIRLAPINNSEAILVDGDEWTVLREEAA